MKISVSLRNQLCNRLEDFPLPLELLAKRVYEFGVLELLVLRLYLALFAEHKRILTFGVRMLVAGLACLVHAFLPFLFKTTGRTAISELHTKMVLHRAKHQD